MLKRAGCAAGWPGCACLEADELLLPTGACAERVQQYEHIFCEPWRTEQVSAEAKGETGGAARTGIIQVVSFAHFHRQ